MGEFRLSFASESARLASAVAVRVEEDGNDKEDEVVGFVHMVNSTKDRDSFSSLVHSLKDGEYYIESMCVVSEMRGKGVGRRLLEFCEARARERNARVLTLGVVANNPAKRLYERFGFVDRKLNGLSSIGDALAIFCIFGFPNWGCGATVMEKDLSITSLAV